MSGDHREERRAVMSARRMSPARVPVAGGVQAGSRGVDQQHLADRPERRSRRTAPARRGRRSPADARPPRRRRRSASGAAARSRARLFDWPVAEQRRPRPSISRLLRWMPQAGGVVDRHERGAAVADHHQDEADDDRDSDRRRAPARRPSRAITPAQRAGRQPPEERARRSRAADRAAAGSWRLEAQGGSSGDRRGAGEQARAAATCRFSTMRPSTTATPSPRASAAAKAAICVSASAISSADGAKTSFAIGDLRRVDQRLAVEPESRPWSHTARRPSSSWKAL